MSKMNFIKISLFTALSLPTLAFAEEAKVEIRFVGTVPEQISFPDETTEDGTTSVEQTEDGTVVKTTVPN